MWQHSVDILRLYHDADRQGVPGVAFLRACGNEKIYVFGVRLVWTLTSACLPIITLENRSDDHSRQFQGTHNHVGTIWVPHGPLRRLWGASLLDNR